MKMWWNRFRSYNNSNSFTPLILLIITRALNILNCGTKYKEHAQLCLYIKSTTSVVQAWIIIIDCEQNLKLIPVDPVVWEGVSDWGLPSLHTLPSLFSSSVESQEPGKLRAPSSCCSSWLQWAASTRGLSSRFLKQTPSWRVWAKHHI